MLRAVVLDEKVAEEILDKFVQAHVGFIDGGSRGPRVSFEHGARKQLRVPRQPYEIVMRSLADFKALVEGMIDEWLLWDPDVNYTAAALEPDAPRFPSSE